MKMQRCIPVANTPVKSAWGKKMFISHHGNAKETTLQRKTHHVMPIRMAKKKKKSKTGMSGHCWWEC